MTTEATQSTARESLRALFSRMKWGSLFALVVWVAGWGGASQAGEAVFAFTQTADRLAITHAGKPVAEYVFRDEAIWRPYFANVYSPGGIKVTRNHPVTEADANDHATMHPGIWLAFGDINSQDYWRNKARMEHVRFIVAPAAKGDRLSFTAEEILRATNGAAVCSLTNRFDIIALANAWLLIWDATFCSQENDVTFGDQEEMGFGARVATGLTEKNGGSITSSAGLTSARKTWGQPSDWCDYSGTAGGERIGITLISDPRNFRPSWWHNRDYGVFVANPFGRAAMKQGDRSAVTVKRGERLRLRFAAAIHQGDGTAPALLYDAFLRIAPDAGRQ